MQLDWTLPPRRAGRRAPLSGAADAGGAGADEPRLRKRILGAGAADAVRRCCPPGDRLPLRVHAEWLACTDQICVPEQADLATEVVVAKAAAPLPDTFARWEQRLPAPLDTPAHMALSPRGLRLAIPLPASVDLIRPHVFLVEDKIVDYAAPQTFARKGGLAAGDDPARKVRPAQRTRRVCGAQAG
ncbi:hypothetical protein ACFSTD_02965 [Novosphingobium colocasiae]